MGNQKSLKLRQPLIIRRVNGHSMQPTLYPGKLVLGWCYFKQLKSGQLVILVIEGREVIKRIKYIKHGMLFVVGDNLAASTDSRELGLIAEAHVTAKVLNF